MRELIHQLLLQLKTLDAYVVELEKENKELKDKISLLESY